MNENKETEKEEEIKKLVLTRIGIMPPNYKLSVGDEGTFNKEELINHIKKGDDIGMQIINMQMSFIKALTSGKLIETLNQ